MSYTHLAVLYNSMILPIFALTDSETGDKYPGLIGAEMKLFINNNHYQLT
jgi:hypothetical protein